MSLKYREDDLLSVFRKWLIKEGYTVFAASGNQQGRFWFQMGNNRKGPDVVAVKENIALVGEAKLLSSDLFKRIRERESDYESLQYMMDNEKALKQMREKILTSIRNAKLEMPNNLFIVPIIVGGTSFDSMKNKLNDNRIRCFSVTMSNGNVEEYIK